jgi:serine/threonine protein kinase
MVKDRKLETVGQSSHFYALKVQKSAEHYTEAAMDEVELLDCIASQRKECEALLFSDGCDKEAFTLVKHSRFVATLHDHFFHSGPNGRHMCMLFSMLGCNLLSVIKAFNYRGIPIDVVKKMTAGVCMGLDFLHRRCQIIHTDLKPENVLLQFPHQISSEEDLAMGVAKLNLDSIQAPAAKSIQQLEAALAETNLSPNSRKKLRRRLKKKRQKERKRGQEADDDEEGSGETEDDTEIPIMLSDFEVAKLLNKTVLPSTNERESDGRIKRRLCHSEFVSANFGPCQNDVDEKTAEIMTQKVTVKSPTADELAQILAKCETQGGIAQLCLMMKAPKNSEHRAAFISSCLGNIQWEQSGSGREWRVTISVPSGVVKSGSQPIESADIEISFLVQEVGIDDVNLDELRMFGDISCLVNDNLCEGDDVDESELIRNGPRPSDVPSLFAITFPARSTYVTLGFLESRLPGVMFMAYKRDEGNPPMDAVLFGPNAKSICDHPMAMRIKSDGNNTCNYGSCLFGFDLRLMRGALNHSDAVASFDMLDKKASRWWRARNSIQDRVKALTGIDPTADMMNFEASCSQRETRRLFTDVGGGFREGEKKPTIETEIPTAPSSRDTSASSAARSASHTPDLNDTAMLMKCRTVIVDLGNACWTHRHFSEDIQTRQYRAPEVIIGSKYDTSADIWSLGCMIFELLTGDLLFDPRAGEDYDRDEDHLAMFQELLGKMPKRIALEGKFAKNFFDKKGNLKRIKQLKFWPVQDVLTEKYHIPREEAVAVNNFMSPLLDFDPEKRATALEALQSDWLRGMIQHER